MTGPSDSAPRAADSRGRRAAEPGKPAPAGPALPAEPAPSAEPRQRWRLTFARDPVPGDQVGRVVLDAWQDALIESGLPLAGLERGGVGRARIAFAAPLPAASRGDAELADLWLVDRRPLWQVREALAPRLPAAHRWVGAEDVWLGAPALAGRVVAADWLIELAGASHSPDRIDPDRIDPDRLAVDRLAVTARLATAARALLAAGTLPRLRVKGATEKRYDLRPLLADVAVHAAADPRAGEGVPDLPVVRIRTRFHPELGMGRPEEVIGALGEAADIAIEIATIARVRLILADELPVPGRPALVSPRR